MIIVLYTWSSFPFWVNLLLNKENKLLCDPPFYGQLILKHKGSNMSLSLNVNSHFTTFSVKPFFPIFFLSGRVIPLPANGACFRVDIFRTV